MGINSKFKADNTFSAPMNNDRTSTNRFYPTSTFAFEKTYTTNYHLDYTVY